jgi:acetyl-CoA carboxylase carboxyl transferase subunit alpha
MLLEFEKPIALLEDKLIAMKEKASLKQERGIMQAIHKLEEKIKNLQAETFHNLTPWQKVQLARHVDRPYTLDYVNYMADEFIPLHGDRTGKDDPAIVGGFAKLSNETVMLIGHQKGRNAKERQARNFGMANPEGYRKALRLMQLANKFNKPIVTLIDTPGANLGIEAEEHGQAEAIARNIQSMFDIQVPIICIVIGEGASGGALGLAVGDKILMLEHTWYSVISPESCSSILWRSWDYKEKTAGILKLTATDMHQLGLIDAIIPEPLGGAHRNHKEVAVTLKQVILQHIHDLQQISPDARMQSRIEKFCQMGITNQATI